MRPYRTPDSVCSGCDAALLIFDIPLDFYFAAALAVMIAAIAKSGFAGGGAILTVPILSLFVTPQMAAAITLPLLVMIDVTNTWRYRRDFHRPSLKTLLPGSVIGVLAGAFLFEYLSAAGMRIGIGLLALYFALHYFLQLSRKTQGHPVGRPLGFGLGAVSGLGSFVAHSGGPPADAFVLSQGLHKTTTVATLVYFFFLVNLMKVIAYWYLDQLNAINLTTSAALVPFVPLGIMIGYFLHSRISQEFFQRFARAMLAIVGVKLLWDGLSAFLS